MVRNHTTADVVLIGAGIMSATLATMLKEIAPEMRIMIFEKLDKPGKESSNVWNNSGTGHAALCELNYTTERKDKSIDISKAISINEQFQLSRQFWSYLVRNGKLVRPFEFIKPLPHMSLVHGEDNVRFLHKRYEALKEHPLFEGMEFTDNPEKLEEWIPLIMENRTVDHPMAATKTDSGTDINFGVLTRKLLENLESQENVEICYNSEVEDLEQLDDGRWEIKVHDHASDVLEYHTCGFLFIGAGGGALPLLQKTGIPESKHVGGFPVSGEFFVCNNPDVIEKHHAKVYGKAEVGAPPMSMPHLDTRFINGEKTLLFGPYAGFSPKFLKTGSNMDLIGSVKPNNLFTMLSAGAKNMQLTRYLIQQLLLSKEQRMNELRKFIPDARSEDWDTVTAGQRVQVIADTEEGGKGTLQFGTELITGANGSVAALLGASPGASTAVHIMLEIFKKCFPDQMADWEPKLGEMIPSYGEDLANNPELIREVRASTAEVLGLEDDLLAKQN